MSADEPCRTLRSLPANQSLVNPYEEVDVRRLLTVAVAVGALSAISVSPAFAEGKNPPTSCGVGNGVSRATHEVGGLGKFFHEIEVNPGEAIQEFHEFIKETC